MNLTHQAVLEKFTEMTGLPVSLKGKHVCTHFDNVRDYVLVRLLTEKVKVKALPPASEPTLSERVLEAVKNVGVLGKTRAQLQRDLSCSPQRGGVVMAAVRSLIQERKLIACRRGRQFFYRLARLTNDQIRATLLPFLGEPISLRDLSSATGVPKGTLNEILDIMPQVELDVRGNVPVWKTKTMCKWPDPKPEEILNLLRGEPKGLTRLQIVARLCVHSSKAVGSVLQRLRAQGEVVSFGETRAMRWRVAK